MAASFIFDPTKGETPESIARQREVANLLAARLFSKAPQNVGEGINAIGQALIARSMQGDADAAQKAGMAGGQELYSGLFGGGAATPAAAPTAPIASDVATPAGATTIPVAPPAPSTTGKIYSNDEPSPLDPPSGQDRQAMVQTILGEAANQGPIGQNAVASVIRNRAINGGFGGDTPTGVVTAPNQFEPWNTAAGRSRMAAAAANPQQAAMADAAISQAYGEGGAAPNDPTNGATMFFSPTTQAALGRPTPSWGRGPGQDIGDHRFFGGAPVQPTQVADAGNAIPPAAVAPASPAQTVPATGDATLPPNAQPAQGALPSTQQVAQAINQQQAPQPNARLQQLQKAIGDPRFAFLNKGQQAAITGEYEQLQKAALQANDPLHQAQLIAAQRANQPVGEPYKDADGNLVQKDALGNVKVLNAGDKTPTSVSEYEYYKKNLGPGEQPMPYQQWSVAKARAGATKITNTVGGEDKGLNEAAKLDAETVRKGQNDQMPALEDADHNFQIMQDAIARNGGKLPTGGTLGKLGLDARRTSNYIRENWGVDLGDDPTTAVSLETFNKGGIKASGDMAKAIGGSRVLKVEFDMAQRANPGLETTDGGNKYLLDVNRNGIAIKRDYLQAQEDYWRGHNHSLDGFQKSWNEELKANPRPLSTFSVVPPIDNGDGSQMLKLPSTGQGGYSWYRKGQDGLQPITDKQVASRLDDSAKPLVQTPTAPITKVIGGKTYIKQDGNWFEKQ